MHEIQPSVSQLVVEATRLRVAGQPLKAIATRMGYRDPNHFRADWRQAYESELGVATPIAAAVELVKLRLLRLNEIARGHKLKPFTKLPSYEQHFLQDLLRPEPSLPRGDWDRVMDFDYIRGQTPEITRQVGARNPVQEAILYLAYLNGDAARQKRFRALSSTSQLTEPITDRPGDLRLSESPKLIGTLLSKRQGDIVMMDAQGLTRKQILGKLQISEVTYMRETRDAHIALGLRPEQSFSKTDAKEAASINHILAAKALMASGELDPAKIAQESYRSEDLVKIFDGLSPRQLLVMKLVAQGQSIDSIITQVQNSDLKQAKKANRSSIHNTLWLLSRMTNSGTKTHLVILYEAYNRIQAQGLSQE